MNYYQKAYTNWESQQADIGCYASGCSGLDGVIIRPDSDFAWNAMVDKSLELPYICLSKCPKGFRWYRGMYQL